MLLKANRFIPGSQIRAYFAIGSAFLLAIALRISLYHVITSDYTTFLSQWYKYIQTHGGFAALKDNFSNYNVPYLYLLAIATYLPIPELIAIKSISVIFDVVLGIFTYLILGLKFRRPYVALIGVLVVLFAPTIFINSSAWGQADATYTAFCLGSLYFLLKGRSGWACVFFGLALAFKLQAVFFLPVFLVLLLRKKLSLKYLVFIPAVFLLLLLPAFIAGRSAGSLLTIYADQINSPNGVGAAGQLNGGTRQFNQGNGSFHGAPGQFNGKRTGQPNVGGTGLPNGGESGAFHGRSAGQFSNGRSGGTVSSDKPLAYNAPTLYQWFPANTPANWKWLGIGLAALVVVLVGILLWRSKEQITAAIILKVTLVFALAIPFLLPEMHERYFYLADVVSIIYAFNFPRLLYIAIIMQLCSLLSYAPYFMHSEIISLSYVAFAVLVITIIAFTDLVLALYPDLQNRINQSALFVEGAPLKVADNDVGPKNQITRH